MTKGILMYAFNNEQLDYVKLASEAARRAKLFLNKPVALITDSPEWVKNLDPDNRLFDVVVDIWNDHKKIAEDLNIKNIRRYNDGSLEQKKLTFKNAIRTKTYDLTPFDETLVIDSDFLIANSQLKYCWEQPNDFLIYKNAQDLSGYRNSEEFVRVSDYTIDFYWATVFFFRKSPETKIFFDLVDHVRDNWDYYKMMYQFSSGIFRNDHAFSIAIHIMNGYTRSNWSEELPGKLLYTLDKDLIYKMSDTEFTFLLEKEKYQGEYTLQKTKNLNVHVMNKFSLGRIISGETL